MTDQNNTTTFLQQAQTFANNQVQSGNWTQLQATQWLNSLVDWLAAQSNSNNQNQQ